MALVAYVWRPGIGGVYLQEPVVVTASGAELLTEGRA